MHQLMENYRHITGEFLMIFCTKILQTIIRIFSIGMLSLAMSVPH